MNLQIVFISWPCVEGSFCEKRAFPLSVQVKTFPRFIAASHPDTYVLGEKENLLRVLEIAFVLNDIR